MHQWNPTEDEVELTAVVTEAAGAVSRTLTLVYGNDEPSDAGPSQPGDANRI